MSRRIWSEMFLAALFALLLFTACVLGILYYDATADAYAALSAKAHYLAAGLEETGDPTGFLVKVQGYSGRITLVAPDGAVLFDDREDVANMPNHKDRSEVAAAMANGTGRAERQSETLGTRSIYYAMRLPGGEVLRVSVDVDSIWGQAAQLIPWLAVAAALLALAAALVARRQARRIVEPINALDLDHPLENPAYPELSPLLRRIEAQKGEIAAQLAELSRRQREFATVTQNMAEGLVVVNADGTVLSVNGSALRILGAKQPSPEGRHILELNRSLELDEAVKAAAGGAKYETELELGGRCYHLAASPATEEGKNIGSVLLLVDDTERVEAEERRREFSANVSHELKTPLTSISGYAELLANDMVKEDDVPGFGARIYADASRLLALIEDIIHLSRLDEKAGSTTSFGQVELLEVAREAAAELAAKAAEAGVKLEVEGTSAEVWGVRSILGEIAYNLIDNAIRYNHKGGSVRVAVRRAPGQDAAILTVADTGIGIAPEEQQRVFERFYRVDKSHSRQSGGTGLGLSIVKRGALFHGGTVTLESVPGEGCEFTVTLPQREK